MRTFVVSLESSLDRRTRIDLLMAKHKLSFEYFDAILVRDGPHPLLSMYDAAKSVRLKGYQMTDRELGCFASHYSLWKKCVDIGEPILILEDNVEIRGDLACRLPSLADSVSRYGVLKLGGVFEQAHVSIEFLDEKYEIVRYAKGTRGTSAYVVSPEIAQAWVELTPGFFEPVDNFMETEWRTQLSVFSIHPWLAARTQTESEIGDRKTRTKSGITSKIVPEIYRGYTRARQRIYHLRQAGSKPQ